MKSFIVALALFAAVVLASEEEGHHRHHHHHHHHHHHGHKDMKCKGEAVVRNEAFEKSMQECSKEIKKHEDDDHAEGRKSGKACRAVCAMTKIGAINEKGLIVESKIREMVNEAFVNQEARKELEEEFTICGRNSTGLGTSLSDNKCSNYKHYFHCIKTAITTTCVDESAHDPEDLE